MSAYPSGRGAAKARRAWAELRLWVMSPDRTPAQLAATWQPGCTYGELREDFLALERIRAWRRKARRL